MKEHSLNVLPKWARERIIRLEKEAEELKLYPVELIAVDNCTVHTNYNNQKGFPIHLCAGDRIKISQPNVNVDTEGYSIPKNMKDCMEDKLRKYIPHEALIYIQWERPS